MKTFREIERDYNIRFKGDPVIYPNPIENLIKLILIPMIMFMI